MTTSELPFDSTLLEDNKPFTFTWDLGIETRDLNLDTVLYQPLFYEEEFIKSVHDDVTVTHTSPRSYVNTEASSHTLKIEGYENYSPFFREKARKVAEAFNASMRHVSIHAFIAYKDSPSFPTHEDLDDVMIHVISGVKTMEVAGETFRLKKGECLYLPANTPHKAINTRESVMLSFGIHYWLEDKLIT